MVKGISVHIGLNAVDPSHYSGWSGPLTACEADAEDMQAIANDKGFQSQILKTSSATRQAVAEAIKNAAQKLTSGDIFLLSYSGHGGQVPDKDNEENDGLDETWCLYDGQIIDDELKVLYAGFASGVRILVFSDSCHSGTVTREALRTITTPSGTTSTRNMPNDAALRTYRKNRSFYDGLARTTRDASKKSLVQGTVLLISGCQDNQLSLDGAFNGKFTGTLLSIWADGDFNGNYSRFHRSIVKEMPATQTPNLLVYGSPNPTFLEQKPFTI